MKAKILKVIGINLAVFLGLLLLIEGIAQAIAVFRPSYDVLFLEPDRSIGWKPTPGMRFTWAGGDWYAGDFSVDVQINSLGFRDAERSYAKKPGVTRVAMLGDSFVEAIQVPLQKTATQLLERQLNSASIAHNGIVMQWEVLNLGVSNFGVGQYLLMWEEYGRRFHPDIVAIFVAKFHMRRTISKYEYRAFTATKDERLWVRPTFRLQDDVVVREPAPDFEKFSKAQQNLIEHDFGGAKSRRKPMRWLTLHYARIFWDEFTRGPKEPPGPEREIVALNLRIIDELGQSVKSAGARLVVIDVSQYFLVEPALSEELQALCARRGFGYVPAYQGLMEANSRGIATRWAFDTHFNEQGNEILASSLYDWIGRNARANTLQ